VASEHARGHIVPADDVVPALAPDGMTISTTEFDSSTKCFAGEHPLAKALLLCPDGRGQVLWSHRCFIPQVCREDGDEPVIGTQPLGPRAEPIAKTDPAWRSAGPRANRAGLRVLWMWPHGEYLAAAIVTSDDQPSGFRKLPDGPLIGDSLDPVLKPLSSREPSDCFKLLFRKTP
jgi:hypothetical protein